MQMQYAHAVRTCRSLWSTCRAAAAAHWCCSPPRIWRRRSSATELRCRHRWRWSYMHRRIYSACAAACMCGMRAACTRSANVHMQRRAPASGACVVRMQCACSRQGLRVQVGVTTGTAIVYDARLCHYGRYACAMRHVPCLYRVRSTCVVCVRPTLYYSIHRMGCAAPNTRRDPACLSICQRQHRGGRRAARALFAAAEG